MVAALRSVSSKGGGDSKGGHVDTVPGGAILLEVVFVAKVECIPEKWPYVGLLESVVRKSSMSWVTS